MSTPPPTSLDPANPAALLCARCGYVIEGLPPASPCPECGTPIAQSHPDARPGSPFQRSPSVRGLFSAATTSLLHPRRLMDSLVIESPVSRRLMWLHILAASSIIAATFEVYSLRHRWVEIDPFDALGLFDALRFIDDTPPIFRLLAVATLSTAAHRALVAIEARGVRFFGARRHWRITPAVADTICGHASLGWTLGALLGLLGATAQWAITVPDGLRTSLALWRFEPGIRFAPYLLGLFVGMMIFETLVFTGVRRCRFANAPRPAPSAAGPRISSDRRPW